MVYGKARLTLAKNVAYNIVKETITYGLIKALSNMYEKLSTSNKTVSLLSAESRGRKFENGQNKGRSRLKSQKRGQSKDRKDIVCWNCQKKGHFRNQCTDPAAPKGRVKRIIQLT
ncbi:hypothetical protein AgCh_028569 [Apium graveolens]